MELKQIKLQYYKKNTFLKLFVIVGTADFGDKLLF